MGTVTHVGESHDDVMDIAWRIQRIPGIADILVWINDHGAIVCAPLSDAPDVSAQSMIGTYGARRSVDVIERDLRATLRHGARPLSRP